MTFRLFVTEWKRKKKVLNEISEWDLEAFVFMYIFPSQGRSNTERRRWEREREKEKKNEEY